MAKNKRTETQILKDRAFIAELLLEGRGPTEITISLNKRRPYNLSESQIRYDIGKIHEEWIKTQLDAYDKSRAKELARIDKLEREYWEAFQRSRRMWKKVEKSESSQSGSGEEGRYSQDSDSEKKEMALRDGNKDFLKGIQECIKLRCKILGLDAPEKLDVTWRERARKYGLDPEEADEAVEVLTEQFIKAAEKGIDKSD